MLVVVVIFLFLRSISATVIASLALPASLVATFIVMYLLDYSLDNLSLMALTLSVGFVVDDAIVMLENIVRHMEMGKSPMRASIDGSKEVAFTILSMTVSLAAVFIPVLFMGGIVGRLLHEFAITIGAAILVSGLVSISLTPMLCSRFLKPLHAVDRGVMYRWTECVFDRLSERLQPHAWPGAPARRRDDGGISAAHCRHGVSVHDRAQGLPAKRGSRTLRHQYRRHAGNQFRCDGAPSARVQRRAAGRPERRRRQRECRSWRSRRIGNTGRTFVELKPRSERSQSVDQIIANLRPKLAEIPGLRVFVTNPPPINLGGQNGGRATYQFTLQHTDTAELYRWAQVAEDKLRQMRGFEDVSSDLLLKNPQVSVEMDRDKVSALGLSDQSRSRPRSTPLTAPVRSRRSTRPTISIK